MRELMCFAAVLGFECNRRAALDSTTSEIDGRIFEQDAARDLVLLIALAEQRDAQLLREERLDECVHIFEEYAEVGLQELASWLRESPEDPHGDRAILTALAKRGYLETRVEAARVAGDVEF
jgi:dnd system-associated protein 4